MWEAFLGKYSAFIKTRTRALQKNMMEQFYRLQKIPLYDATLIKKCIHGNFEQPRFQDEWMGNKQN